MHGSHSKNQLYLNKDFDQFLLIFETNDVLFTVIYTNLLSYSI